MKRPELIELEFTLLLFIVTIGFVAPLLYGIVGLLSYLKPLITKGFPC
jgi:hypothetical protein